MTRHFVSQIANQTALFICIFLFNIIPAMGESEGEAEDTATVIETSTETSTEINTDTVLDYIGDHENKDEYFSYLDSPHENISSGLEYVSSGIDAFFSNEKFYRETTSSYIHYRIDTLFKEAGQHTMTGKLRIRVDLPITRKKLKLVFESDPIEPENSRQPVSNPSQETDKADYNLSLEAKPKKKRNWRISRSIGIKVRLPLDPYARIRITRDFPFDVWTLRVNETLYWFKSRGSGFDTYLDFERKVTDKVLFRASSAARWSDENDYFLLSQYFTIFHTLSDRRAISYYFGAFGQSQPEIYATDYIIGTSYRQRIHRDWLFYEIKPEVHYQKINGFEPEHKITFSLEAFFGSKYL